MFGMMQEKPQPSIRHIQDTGRAALKLGATTIAWSARPRTHAQSGESTAHGKLCCNRRNHRHGNPLSWKIGLAQKSSQARRCAQKKKKRIHNAPNTSIQEPGIFVMTGKIWEYQNKGAMDGNDKLGRNCKCCGNGGDWRICLCFPALLPPPDQTENPAHGMNHERGLHFLGYSGLVSGFCVAGGMFIYPVGRLPVSRALRGQ